MGFFCINPFLIAEKLNSKIQIDITECQKYTLCKHQCELANIKQREYLLCKKEKKSSVRGQNLSGKKDPSSENCSYEQQHYLKSIYQYIGCGVYHYPDFSFSK
jgi:hypothetical protein